MFCVRCYKIILRFHCNYQIWFDLTFMWRKEKDLKRKRQWLRHTIEILFLHWDFLCFNCSQPTNLITTSESSLSIPWGQAGYRAIAIQTISLLALLIRQTTCYIMPACRKICLRSLTPFFLSLVMNIFMQWSIYKIKVTCTTEIFSLKMVWKHTNLPARW